MTTVSWSSLYCQTPNRRTSQHSLQPIQTSLSIYTSPFSFREMASQPVKPPCRVRWRNGVSNQGRNRRRVLQQGRPKKGCMVGGKHRWVVADDRGNGWMPPEFVFQKLTDMLPMPPRRMLKAPVKEQITGVQGRRIQRIFL